jgi:hypothetical protein
LGSKQRIAELENANAQLKQWFEHLKPLADRVPVLEADNATLRQWVDYLKGAEAFQVSAQVQTLSSRVDELQREIVAADKHLAGVKDQVATARAKIVETEETALLQEVGIYEYNHPLKDAVAYQAQLKTNQDAIKALARSGGAVRGATNWTVNNSAQQGQKMIREFSKLMLRAYNAEADNAVRTLKPYSLGSAISRLQKARETIAKLGQTMQIAITEEYHRLRRNELELTADYLAKKDEEKERLREERERQREEEKARREFEAEKARLTKEQSHYLSALAKLQEKGDAAGAADMQSKLEEIAAAIKGVEDRAANIRAGYVYVISNFGSFGERMVKIGMTRRLEPMDRVRELGDASVPFRYDVHALVFSDDAVSLEGNLHEAFTDRRVNLVNPRREFFYATPVEVREALKIIGGQQLLVFHEVPEATEWRASGGSERQDDLVLETAGAEVPGIEPVLAVPTGA